MSLDLSQIAARTLWVTTPKMWLFNEEIAATTKIDGLAAIPPGAKMKPFIYDRNPYPFFFIPGRNRKNVSLQFRPDRQDHMRKAQAAFQADFDKVKSKGQRSSGLMSIPAEVIYSNKIGAVQKCILANLYNFRTAIRDDDRNPVIGPDGKVLREEGGWMNRRLLVNRSCAGYRRRLSDGEEVWQSDTGKFKAALDGLVKKGIISYKEVEKDGKRVYVFRFRDDWLDRLGYLPRMPDERRVRPGLARLKKRHAEWFGAVELVLE